MASFIIDFVEPPVLLGIYCSSRGRDSPIHPAVKRGALGLSWLCFVLTSMALAACWAVAQEIIPPAVESNCTVPEGCGILPLNSSAGDSWCDEFIPPPPPPPVSPLLDPGQVYLTYALCGLCALIKLVSYWNGIPASILRWSRTKALA